MNCIKGAFKYSSSIQADRIRTAPAKTVGYGIAMPVLDEMSLEKPEIIKQAVVSGVKHKPPSPSIHLIRADIETEVAPW